MCLTGNGEILVCFVCVCGRLCIYIYIFLSVKKEEDDGGDGSYDVTEEEDGKR